MNGGDLVRRLDVPGLRFTATGLEFTADVSFEQWDKVGLVLAEARDWSAWGLGDWLNFGEARFGERYAQASALTDRSHGGLRNLAYVARKVPPRRRREALSWSHHRLIAPFDEVEQTEWLTRAEAEGWSVDLLDSMLRDAGLGVTARLQPDGEAEVVAVVRELRREIPDLDAERVARIVREGVERERRETRVVELPASQLQVAASLRELAADILAMPRDEHGRACLDRNGLERLRAALDEETT